MRSPLESEESWVAWPRVVVGAAAQMAAAGSVVSGELEQGGGRAYRARWTWLKAQEWSKRGTWGGEGLLLLLLAQLRRHPCEGQAARVWRCRCLDAWLWRGGAHADDATVSPPHPPIPPKPPSCDLHHFGRAAFHQRCCFYSALFLDRRSPYGFLPLATAGKTP